MQISGRVTYNGRSFVDFQPLRTASYVEQTDTRLIPEMTVRETLDFAARCQGSGLKKGGTRNVRPLCVMRVSEVQPTTPKPGLQIAVRGGLDAMSRILDRSLA